MNDVTTGGGVDTVSVDGTETTGGVQFDTAAGQVAIIGGVDVQYWGEVGFVDNVVWTAGATGTTVALLCKNQTAYYGITPGTYCS
jgi:hypothetical protein